MENKADKYDILIDKLRKTNPVLQDAEGLTDSIMKLIENKSLQPESRMIIWVRAVSSVAALFLLGLFVIQQIEAKRVIVNNHQLHEIETCTNLDPLTNLNPFNGHTYLMKAYLCYMQQHSIENNRLKEYYEHFNNE